MAEKMTDELSRIFGQDTLDTILGRAGLHSSLCGNHPPPIENSAERLVFGLLEILDFQCCKYGDFSGMSESEIRAFLIDHRGEILKMEIDPPSYLGMFCGVLNSWQIDKSVSIIAIIIEK